MKTNTSNISQFFLPIFALIGIIFIPFSVYSFEPIATLGKNPPEKNAFLNNNTYLQTSYFETTIKIIDRDTGEIVDEFGHRPKNSNLVFSPHAKYVAILDYTYSSNTTAVVIWDVNTREIVSEWESETSISDDAAFSPTEPLLATSDDDRISIWNWESQELIGEMIGERRQREECYIKTVEHENGVRTTKSCATSAREHEMQFTPDGNYLIVASKRPDIEIWNVRTRQLIGHFEGHTGNWVYGIAISSDGKLFASYEKESNNIYMWDIPTRQLLWKETIIEDGILDILFGSDNQQLYVAKKNVYILDVDSGQQIDSFGSDYPGLRQMILSPDEKTLLIQYDGGALRGGVIQLWNTENKILLNEYADYIGGIPRLSPDGQTMATIETSFIKVWDIPTQQVRFVIPAQYFGLFFLDKGMAISSDNKRIAYSRYPGLEITNLESGEVEAQNIQFTLFNEDITFSNTGNWLTAVDTFGYLFLFDVRQPHTINRMQIFYRGGVKDFLMVAFSDDDEHMAATARTGENGNYQYWILLWKRIGENFEYQYRWKISEPDDAFYSTLTFAKHTDGSTVLASAHKIETNIWKILPQNAILANTLPFAQAPLHFSPDDRYLYTNRYYNLQIWDWQTSRPIKFQSIPEYRDISRDGSILVSMDEDARYLIWDAKNIFSTLPYSVEAKDKKLVTLGQIKRNQLLQNFPNPFNPETWIPFKLADESDVKIKIYTITGEITRTLTLGRMAAGDYTTPSKAIHWDGRNDRDEPVSSGVYLYTIFIDDFSATRKMLIRK